ncbi:MAG TPA: hypothetical protein VFZ32_04150 [Micromonosporaceae bacterium]
MSTAAAPRYEPVVPPPPARSRQAGAKPGLQAPTRGSPRGRSVADAGVTEPPPAPVAAPRAPFVMLVLLLVAAGIVGLLVLNTKINEDSFRLEGLRDRQATLDVREQQLRSELASKQSPGNLAAAARLLGLVQEDSPAFLYLPDGRVIEVPRPARADRTQSGG